MDTESWAEAWIMKFNIHKRVMYPERNVRQFIMGQTQGFGFGSRMERSGIPTIS